MINVIAKIFVCTVIKLSVRTRRRFLCVSAESLIETVDRSSKMGNGYRASDDECDIKHVKKLRARHARAGALFNVVSNAVVTPENDGSDQAKQFLRAFVERAVFIRLRVQSEEAFDSQVIAAQQLFVHLGSISVEFVHQEHLSSRPVEHQRFLGVYVRHSSSPPAALQKTVDSAAAVEPGCII